MTDKNLCKKCRFRNWSRTIGHYCDYVYMTGHTRLAQMTEEQRAAGYCPVMEEGEQIRLTMVPRLHRLNGPSLVAINRDKYDKAHIAELYGAGMHDLEIAAIMKCSVSIVRKWRHRNNLPLHKKGEK